MDRSFAARAGFAALPRRRRSATRRGAKQSSLGHIAELVWAQRRLRTILLSATLALALLAGGWLWLRNSPLVSVEHIRISGVHGADAAQIEAALERSARQMSTLDLHPGELQAAVAGFPQVRSLGLSSGFPHSLSIIVHEQPPVAVMVVNGERSALAADGAVLGSSFASGALPEIDGQALEGAHIHNRGTLEYLTVLGAAPATLETLVQRAYTTPRGLTLAMQGGLLVYFGDASNPHAKWNSLARVLADPSSSGASYIDVRLPERPAAGMTGESTAGESAQSSGLDPNSATLAKALEGAISGAGASKPATEAASQASPSAPTQSEPQSSSSTAPQTSTATSTENPTNAETPTSGG
jgi:cell division protein FtsQ